MLYNSQLTVFLHVADCGSFNKASEALFISPPAVMKQINALEAQLDMKLFERTNHGIRLTMAGESIYKDAKYLVDYSNKAVEAARGTVVDPAFTICVATSLLSPCKPFLDLWYQIHHKFPDYKLHIVPFDDDNGGILPIIASLGKTSDFVVGICDSPQWLDRCSFLKLGEYKRSYAVPSAHRLAAKKALEPADLSGETLMIPKRGISPTVDWERDMLEQNHPQIKLVDIPLFYDMELFNRCVHTGSILSSYDCWADIHPSLVTIPAAPERTIPYGLMYAANPPGDILEIISHLKSRQAL